jgi:hypothetical protein
LPKADNELTETKTMRRPHRLIAAAVLIAFSGVLSGCSGFGTSFDPTDMLDWLDTKKKLPGDRKPVFPEGVPGLEQGVPKDLYKGAQGQRDEQAAAAAAAAAQPPADTPPKKQAKGKKTKQPADTAAQQPAGEVDGEAAAASEEASAAAPPAPPPKKIVRKRTTAPPPDQPDARQAQPAQQQAAPPAQQSASPFPAPLPGGTFTR